MDLSNLKSVFVLLVSSLLTTAAFAAPITYEINSGHTYPSFEADHNGGMSVWRGKINSTTGTIVMDREAETGSIDVEMDMNSIDFGSERMNAAALDHVIYAEDYPTASYTGELAAFVDGSPTMVNGMLTLHGVTNELDLTINSFLCKPHFRHGREVCGADASTSFDRSDYNILYGLDGGFLPFVNLLISVEAVIPESE
jgi:polyisoprenoid-binding protein YceI